MLGLWRIHVTQMRYITPRATASIKVNLTDIERLGQLWNSSDLLSAYDSLSKGSVDANVGALKGNRMFYNNDYMVSFLPDNDYRTGLTHQQVHRGRGYVTTMRMYSNRTRNTECVNSQNVCLQYITIRYDILFIRCSPSDFTLRMACNIPMCGGMSTKT